MLESIQDVGRALAIVIVVGGKRIVTAQGGDEAFAQRWRQSTTDVDQRPMAHGDQGLQIEAIANAGRQLQHTFTVGRQPGQPAGHIFGNVVADLQVGDSGGVPLPAAGIAVITDELAVIQVFEHLPDIECGTAGFFSDHGS